jgi:hypothetical protein
MLFKVVSILVACTTSQATAPGRSVRNLGEAALEGDVCESHWQGLYRTCATGLTCEPPTPSVPELAGREKICVTATAPGRSVRNLGKAEDALKELEGKFDFQASKFESKINAEKFGLKLKYPIGKWLGKIITILSFFGLLGGLGFGLYNQAIEMVKEIKEWLESWGSYLEPSLIYYGLISLLLTNAYGYWKVKSARNAYLIMFGFDILAVSLYVTFVTGRLTLTILGTNALSRLVNIALLLFVAAVFLFNWYKVLYPAWTGFGDW